MPNPKLELPPCATWDIWCGAEVEGTSGVGEKTLFIRSLRKYPHTSPADDWSFLATKSKCTRVWFCKEFTNWPLMHAIARHFPEGNVCVEFIPQSFSCLPYKVRKKYRLYMKVDVDGLKPGDQVCVGPPFSDETFEIGTGVRVTPTDYLNDVRIA